MKIDLTECFQLFPPKKLTKENKFHPPQKVLFGQKNIKLYQLRGSLLLEQKQCGSKLPDLTFLLKITFFMLTTRKLLIVFFSFATHQTK